MGDQPGPYTRAFWVFALAWAPWFLGGAALYRRDARRERARGRAAG
ncbi:MAG: hypothetical protein H6713_38935 [Myxococcales bacterium]|nr:hypothetical protein [Myxococcales bacterium]